MAAGIAREIFTHLLRQGRHHRGRSDDDEVQIGKDGGEGPEGVFSLVGAFEAAGVTLREDGQQFGEGLSAYIEKEPCLGGVSTIAGRVVLLLLGHHPQVSLPIGVRV